MNDLDNVEQFNFKIIQGQTGSAKTKILSSLKNLKAQVLDLEDLACHRGSLLGKELDKKQPSQRYFETLLHNKIFEFDSNFPIYLESESSKIGNLHIPNKIWEKFSESERILLEVPSNERVKFLLNEYDHLTKKKDSKDTRITISCNATYQQDKIEEFCNLEGTGTTP